MTSLFTRKSLKKCTRSAHISNTDELRAAIHDLKYAEQQLDVDLYFNGVFVRNSGVRELIGTVNENQHRLRHLEVWETTIGEAEVSLISEQSENLLELKLRQCNFNSHALDNLQGDTRRLFRDIDLSDTKDCKPENDQLGGVAKGLRLWNLNKNSICVEPTCADLRKEGASACFPTEEMGTTERKNSFDEAAAEFYVGTKDDVMRACGKLSSLQTPEDINITIFGGDISSCDVCTLFQASSRNRKRVIRLVMHDCVISNDAADLIAEKINHLNELTLNRCKISEQVLRCISKSIQQRRYSLNVLDLSYNGIADCCALASALHKIQALYLSHCEISTTCLQAIQSATRRKDVNCRVVGLEWTYRPELASSSCPPLTESQPACPSPTKGCKLKLCLTRTFASERQPRGDCDFAEDDEDIEKTSVVVGPAGGLVQVGMCYIQVPEGALDDDVSMTLTLNYERNSRTNRITPLLECEPHGQMFKKDVEIFLPTCFVVGRTGPVKAQVRRSVDGITWKVIKQIGFKRERFFKFTVRTFSWYDVIVNLWWRDLSIEKLVSCYIPQPYGRDPQRLVLVCRISDAMRNLHDEHQYPYTYETSLKLRKDETFIVISLSNNAIDISPQQRRVDRVRDSSIHQAQFVLSRKQDPMLYQGIGIKFATKKTETVPDEFYIWDRESKIRDWSSETGETRGISDCNPKISCKSIQGNTVGCDKVYHTENHYHISDPETGNQLALQCARNKLCNLNVGESQ